MFTSPLLRLKSVLFISPAVVSTRGRRCRHRPGICRQFVTKHRAVEGAILRSIALYNWFSASHTENGYSVSSPSIPLRTYTHGEVPLSISLIFSLSLRIPLVVRLFRKLRRASDTFFFPSVAMKWKFA